MMIILSLDQVHILGTGKGALCDPETTTSVSAFRVDTFRGQTGEQIAQSVIQALLERGVTCIQRVGNIINMDAGLEMPSILFVNSEDPGLGYATQAANIPTGVEPHSAPGIQ